MYLQILHIHRPFVYLQVSVLDQAASVHPDSSWWIKADGVDVLPGLGESMRMEWSGDVDLNDGALQRQHSATRLHQRSRITREKFNTSNFARLSIRICAVI